MKGCAGYRAHIQFYLDKELRGPSLEEFRSHIEECADCRQELEAEEELSRLFARSRPLHSAPIALRNRVLRMAAEASSLVRSTPLSLRQRLWMALTHKGRSSRHHSGARWMLAAAILVVMAGFLLLPMFLQQVSASTYIEAAVSMHHSFVDGRIPLGIQSASAVTVSNWFAGKVPFSFCLPISGKAAGSEAPYTLTGGSVVSYKGANAALVAYEMQKEKITLLIVSDTSAAAAGGETIRSETVVFHHTKQAGLNIFTWTNHGLTYALVSSFPGSGRQSCLVCHQDMADGHRFTAHL